MDQDQQAAGASPSDHSDPSSERPQHQDSAGVAPPAQPTEGNGSIPTERNGSVPSQPKPSNGVTAAQGDLPPPYTETVRPASHGSVDVKVEPVSNGKHAKGDSSKSADGEDKSEDDEPKVMVGTFALFKFADGLDILLMLVGMLAALAHGAGLPAMIIVFGEMINSFVDSGNFCELCDLCVTQNATSGVCLETVNQFLVTNTSYTCTAILTDTKILESLSGILGILAARFTNETIADPTADVLARMTDFAIYYVIIGCGVMVCAYLQVGFFSLAALRQSHRIRLQFLRAVTRQNMGWFDCTKPGELANRLTDDINKIQEGMGDKLGTFVQMLSATVAGMIIGFVYGWKLTLVVLAASPLLMVASAVMAKSMAVATSGELKAYAKAGAVADEVLSSIRTVVAFNGQEKEWDRYSNNLSEARKLGIRKGIYGGAGLGFVMFVVYAAYALGFWYGTKLVLEGEPNFGVGNLLIVFFCVLIGAFSLGNAGPFAKTLATARGAAYAVFDVISRDPPIDTFSAEGSELPSVRGDIQLKGVHFEYPSRPDVKVLKGLDVKIGQGKTVALVGSSGCGKSTVIQLIQRFYDPTQGVVELDGRDIRSLSLPWLRSQIGIVSQEPVLFATSIKENIKYGRDGVSDEEIIRALQEANAHDFVMQLPDKLETLVGERGAQLSGGQKQRIAIARALVNKPKILLLDEATSALDTESEATVQAALDKVREGRTTIIIAHRLSTIQTADEIVGVQDGTVVEHGTHEELMRLQGVYYNLVTKQQRQKSKTEDAGEVGEEGESSGAEEYEDGVEELSKSPERKRTFSTNSNGVGNGKNLERALSVVSDASIGEKDAEEKEAKKVEPVGFLELMKWNLPECGFIILGCLGALVNGGSQPAFAIIMSKILAIFQGCDNSLIETQANLYSLLFLILAIAILVASFVQSGAFGVSGENLTLRLRQQTFKAILRQEVSYFDDPTNSTGALTTRLSTEASAIQGATGVRLGGMFQALANMGTAIVIAFVYSWQLSLLILAFMPIIGIAGFIEMKLFAGADQKDKKSYEAAGKVASECISNIRTVQSLRREQTFNQLYEIAMDPPYKKELKKSQGVAVSFGVSQAIIYFAYAACFSLGAYLIKEKLLNFEDMMITFSVVIFGAMALGQASSFAPDYTKGVEAAGYVKAIIQAVPAIDIYSTEGEQPANYKAEIEFNNVQFAYPTRPSVKVLRDLSLVVKPGQRVALVGSSGCGKSTSVGLMERFYDPMAGSVLLDNRSLSSLNLKWLRQQIGLVSQEPVLFDRSVRENIAYGDNSRQVTMNEIIDAAKGANIHDFISQLPDGYETRVGDKGTQLSGGQKQRVAIARALLRNPKILLLDEATSALDTESEQVVQEALDKAQVGRTSLVIAHRLSTIQNADAIVVIQKGKVTEVGTHSQLMERGGFYRKLQTIQRSNH